MLSVVRTSSARGNRGTVGRRWPRPPPHLGRKFRAHGSPARL